MKVLQWETVVKKDVYTSTSLEIDRSPTYSNLMPIVSIPSLIVRHHAVHSSPPMQRRGMLFEEHIWQ